MSKFISAYSNRPKRAYVDLGDNVSRTRAEFANSCDINKLMSEVRRTGFVPQVVQGFYADVSNLGDYQQCLDRLIEARDSFAGLPAKIRRRFDNDPRSLLAFLRDPANRPEAEKLGILDKRNPVAAPNVPPQGVTPPPTGGGV